MGLRAQALRRLYRDDSLFSRSGQATSLSLYPLGPTSQGARELRRGLIGTEKRQRQSSWIVKAEAKVEASSRMALGIVRR